MNIKHILLAGLFAGISFAQAVEIPLKNSAFVAKDDGTIIDWHPLSRDPEAGTVSVVPYKDGKFAVKISSTTAKNYFGIWQGGFKIQKFPRPAADEKLIVSMTFRQKNENVLNGGFVTFKFFSKKGYLMGRETKRLSGTFDWSDREVSVEFPNVPAETAFFTVNLFLGKTTGAVYFAEPKLFMEVVKK